MKTSIKISTAIIMIAILLSLYYAAHKSITGFDACIFMSLVACGGLIEKAMASIAIIKTARHKNVNHKLPTFKLPIEVGLAAIHNDIPKLLRFGPEKYRHREGVEL